MTKVIDNLQIKIKGIHLRIEDTHFFRQPISLGVTLERLYVESVNEAGHADFIDRTLAKNKLKPIRKHLDLRNFGVYCEPRDQLHRLISQGQPTDEESKEGDIAAKEDAFGKMFMMDNTQAAMALGYE